MEVVDLSKAKKYPNRDALREANDLYLDAMRPFIIRHLKKVQGRTVEDLIAGALDDRQADDFWEKLDEDDDIESAIDFSYFPPIIHARWEEVFGQRFKWDMTVRNMLWLIKDGRNSCEHRGRKDLDAEFTRMHLFLIGAVLGKINKPNEKQEVEAIREELFSDDTAERLAEAEERLATAESENAEHKKSLAEVEKRVKASEKKENASKKQLETTANQLAAAETERNDYKERLETTAKELEEAKSEWSTCEENLKSASDRLEDAIGEWMVCMERLAAMRNLFTIASIGNQAIQEIFPPFETNAAVRILDRRETNKQHYLLNLLEQEEPTIIYVQSEEKIDQLLTLVGSEKAAVIGKHNERTSETEETEILERLENKELIAVVSDTPLSTLTAAHCVEHFVFCHLVPGLDTFFEQCQPAFTSEKHTYLHLIYDSEQDINGLTQKYPDREVLEQLYPELRKLAETNDNFIKTENLYSELDIAKLSIETGLAIFGELQLLERNGDNIKLLPPTGKKLDESEIYRRGEKLKRETMAFQTFQLEHSIEQIWEGILEKLGVDSEQILRERNIHETSSDVSGMDGDVQSSKQTEQDSRTPTIDNAGTQETSTPFDVSQQHASKVVDDPDGILIKESDAELHSLYEDTENAGESNSTVQEVAKSTKTKAREKKSSIAERYVSETTVGDRDRIAAKVVELRINATGSKGLSWREIREKLGLKNDQFHKVIRHSEGYRKAVIQRIKSLKAQEGGWEYNGKLEVLTGIELTEKELE